DWLADLVGFAGSSALTTAAESIDFLAESIRGLKQVLGGGDKDDKPFDFKKWTEGLPDFIGLLSPLMKLLSAPVNFMTDNPFEEWPKWLQSLATGMDKVFKFFEGEISWDEMVSAFKRGFETVKEGVKDAWNGFWDWLTGLFSGGGDGSSSSGDLMGGASIFDNLGIDDWGDKLGEKLETAKSWILEKWEGFKSWLGGLFGGGEGGGSAFQVAIDFIMNALDFASDIIGNVVNTAKEWAGRAWDGILNAIDWASTTVETVKNNAREWISRKWQGVLTALDNARTTITNVKNKALNYAKSKYQAVLRALDNARGTIQNVKNKALDYARGKYQAVMRAHDNARGTISSVKNKALNY